MHGFVVHLDAFLSVIQRYLFSVRTHRTHWRAIAVSHSLLPCLNVTLLPVPVMLCLHRWRTLVCAAGLSADWPPRDWTLRRTKLGNAWASFSGTCLDTNPCLTAVRSSQTEQASERKTNGRERCHCECRSPIWDNMVLTLNKTTCRASLKSALAKKSSRDSCETSQ